LTLITQKYATRTATCTLFVVLCVLKEINSEKMVNGSESDFSMVSVDEQEIIRRVEFEDGRVVHLPNEMSEERVY
jgi:hypothetical protein